MLRATVLILLSQVLIRSFAAESADGAFRVGDASGWETLEETGAALALGRGRGRFTIIPLRGEGLDIAAKMDAARGRLVAKGTLVGPVESFRSVGGIAYLAAGFGPEGSGTLFGYFAVGGKAYSFLSRGAPAGEVRRMLDGLSRNPAPPEQPAPPAETGPVAFLDGAIEFERAPGWEFRGGSPAALTVGGSGWGFSLDASAVGDAAGGSAPGEVKTLTALYLARSEARLVGSEGCRKRGMTGDKLINGWKFLYVLFDSCPKPGMRDGVWVSGVLLPGRAPLTAVEGNFRRSRQFDSFRSWLAGGRETAEAPESGTEPLPDLEDDFAARGSPSEALPGPEEPVRFILLPAALGLLAAALFAAAFALWKRRRGRAENK